MHDTPSHKIAAGLLALLLLLGAAAAQAATPQPPDAPTLLRVTLPAADRQARAELSARGHRH